MDLGQLEHEHQLLMNELDILGETWLEYRAAGLDTKQLDIAIRQCERESRRVEKHIRNEKKRSNETGN